MTDPIPIPMPEPDRLLDAITDIATSGLVAPDDVHILQKAFNTRLRELNRPVRVRIVADWLRIEETGKSLLPE